MAEFEIAIDSKLIQDLFLNDRGIEELAEVVLNQVLESGDDRAPAGGPLRAHRRAPGPAKWPLHPQNDQPRGHTEFESSTRSRRQLFDRDVRPAAAK